MQMITHKKFRLTLYLLAIVTLGLLSLGQRAQAQSETFAQPMSIVVNPAASLEVEVWLNKRNPDGSPAAYRLGERVEIGASATEEAYLYAFNVDSNGSVTQIFPNRYDDANRVRAGRKVYFGAPGAPYQLSANEPVGEEWVVVLASRDRLDTSQLVRFQSEADRFATGSHSPMSFAQTMSIVVEPVDETNWVTDSVLLNTVR